MSNTHFNMDQIIKDIQVSRGKLAMLQAVCEGDARALKIVQEEGSVKIRVDVEKEIPIGTRQVESLLRFSLERNVERAIEDALADHIVYDQLGEHRILGRAKKPKRKKAPSRIAY